jgi:ribosomal protein L27
MSFLSSGRALRISKSFNGLSLGPVVQVRTATKKVAGSRTSMKDSAGRRLGAKAAENEPVKTGQILMRQRGTRFYPGENASIGKDHTIYASEPGYVRFYLDPFHPERKFIGVALKPELRLPTPHFEPRVRRLGYVPITDDNKAAFEEKNLSRKDHLLRPTILKNLEDRQNRRSKALEEYAEQLKCLFTELSEKEVVLAAERFLLIKNHFKNGVTLADSRAATTSIYFQDLKLQVKRGSISQEESEALRNEYTALIGKVDSSVSFDNKFQLTKYLTKEARKTQLSEFEQKLQAIVNAKGKDTKKQLEKTLEKSTLITPLEKKTLHAKFIKPLLPSTAGLSKTPVSKRWNYEKKRLEPLSS